MQGELTITISDIQFNRFSSQSVHKSHLKQQYMSVDHYRT